ncbi:hypothetical protein COP2_009977 [Malus domestica]
MIGKHGYAWKKPMSNLRTLNLPLVSRAATLVCCRPSLQSIRKTRMKTDSFTSPTVEKREEAGPTEVF